jgi:hypothetical protein
MNYDNEDEENDGDRNQEVTELSVDLRSKPYGK